MRFRAVVFGAAAAFILLITIAVSPEASEGRGGTNGMILSVHYASHSMAVACADGDIRTIRWDDSTRIESRATNPTVGELAPGARISYALAPSGLARTITVRTQLDEAAWYTAKVACRFRIHPTYISNLHTAGASFEDIALALYLQEKADADVAEVIQERRSKSWEEVAARYGLSDQDLEGALEATFGGTAEYGIGGMDQ